MQTVLSSNSPFLVFGAIVNNVAPSGIILNPDFNDGPINGASWMCSGNATISSGKLVFGGGGGGGFIYEPHGRYSVQPVLGANYVLSFYVNLDSVGSIRAVLNNTSILDVTVSGTGLYSFPFVYSNGDSTFNFQDKGFTGSIEWCQISAA